MERLRVRRPNDQPASRRSNARGVLKVLAHHEKVFSRVPDSLNSAFGDERSINEREIGVLHSLHAHQIVTYSTPMKMTAARSDHIRLVGLLCHAQGLR